MSTETPSNRPGSELRMGKVGKGIKCTVTGCGEDAVRSVSPVDVSRAGLKSTSSGRGYLCKAHYNEMKKKLRKDKELERMRMTG